MENEVTDWHIQRMIVEQLDVDEAVEFCRSLGFRMSEEHQLEFWKKLRDECNRLLEK